MVLPMNYSDRIGWLSVACVLCMCITASTAMHLATWPQIFSACHTSTHVDDCTLQRWSLHALCILPLATAPFQWLLHRSETVCWSQSGHCRRCKFSAVDWKTKLFAQYYSWLRTSHCTDCYYVTSLFRLIVTCVLVVLGFNATLKFICPSSSSSPALS